MSPVVRSVKTYCSLLKSVFFRRSQSIEGSAPSSSILQVTSARTNGDMVDRHSTEYEPNSVSPSDG